VRQYIVQNWFTYVTVPVSLCDSTGSVCDWQKTEEPQIFNYQQKFRLLAVRVPITNTPKSTNFKLLHRKVITWFKEYTRSFVLRVVTVTMATTKKVSSRFGDSSDSDDESYEEVEVGYGSDSSDEGTSSSGSFPGMTMMPAIEESEKESSSSSDNDSSDDSPIAVTIKEVDPDKKTPQTVVKGSFFDDDDDDDDEEEDKPPAKAAAKDLKPEKVTKVAAKDKIPPKLDSAPVKSAATEKKVDDKKGKSVPAEKKTDAKKGKSVATEKKADDKKEKSTAAEKKADDKKGKSAAAEKKEDGMKGKSDAAEKSDGTKGKSATAEKKTDDKKGKSAAAEEKTDGKKGKSAAAEKKTDDKRGKGEKKSKITATEKKTDDKKGESAATEKKADDKKGKSASVEKKAVDKKGKSASVEKKADDKKGKSASIEKKEDVKKGKSAPAQKKLLALSETPSVDTSATGKKPLFGSWVQNVEEEVFFSTEDPNDPNNPDEPDKPDESAPKNRGLFGSLRRKKSHDSLDEDNPDVVASTDESTKEKKSIFGSLRRRKSRDSLDEDNPEAPMDDENTLDVAASAASADESTKEKKGIFGSLRRRMSRDSLDEENPEGPADNESNPDVFPEGPVDNENNQDVLVDNKSPFALSSDEENPAIDTGNSFETHGTEPSHAKGGPLQDGLPDDHKIMEETPTRFPSPFRRSKATNKEKTARALAVPVGALDDERGPDNSAYYEERKPVTCRKLSAALILAIIVLVLTNIGTSYLGAKLAIENFALADDNYVAPINDDTVIENITGPCPFEDVQLEFKIRFDNKPGDVGAFLRDTGPIRATLWNFGAGAFFSFSQFQRENTFSICVSPSLPYEFEMVDTAGDGLVGQFVDTVIYGDWQLMYNGEMVAKYNGDCNAANLTHCGAYCSCSYSLRADGSDGGCQTDCTGTI
jgi:hypothetical protein